MRERPILFSGPMVRALLEGRKTQTRRAVKVQSPDGVWSPERDGKWWPTNGEDYVDTGVACPYGKPGDRLWVRETWGAVPRLAGCEKVCPERDHDGQGIRYRATWDRVHSVRWRPSIHMPRVASRISLEITEVRVERLQDISEDDARAEGLKAITKDGHTVKYGIPDSDGFPGTDDTGWPWAEWNVDPRKAFRRLWERINGAESWAANPFVWVLSFQRVTP